MWARLAVIAVLVAGRAGADLAPRTVEPIILPSGHRVTFHEVISDAKGYGLTIRFRFLAPWLAETIETTDYQEIEADMAFLCETYALPRVPDIGPQPAMIVVSLAQAKVPFGEPAPGVAQIFEAYRPDAGVCLWEGL
ncbi:DUF6497 family protein [Aliiroseovarius sp. PTFE2010]|uniref:DUF6497 family protein n=1 Tax=Aliiroseovarius sp. PTFE2010 TaxID=3417190 RepID=UPI003CFA9E91